MAASLQGKSIIVTGGASGIGRATAILFAREGAKVTIADVDEDGSRETLGLIEAEGGEAQFIRTDVSREDEVRSMVDLAEATYGALHGAANVAAIAHAAKVTAELSLEDWNRVIAVDLTGAFLCVKHQARAMLRAGGGS